MKDKEYFKKKFIKQREGLQNSIDRFKKQSEELRKNNEDAQQPIAHFETMIELSEARINDLNKLIEECVYS